MLGKGQVTSVRPDAPLQHCSEALEPTKEHDRLQQQCLSACMGRSKVKQCSSKLISELTGSSAFGTQGGKLLARGTARKTVHLGIRMEGCGSAEGARKAAHQA